MGSAGPDLPSARPERSPAPILLVDDDEDIRTFVGMVLVDEGYEVWSAADGAQALERVRQAQTRPGLILLDVRMPIMDGRTFSQAYRQMPGPHAPIVVVTAAYDTAAEVAEVQADDSISKPFDLDQLLELVARYLGR
jgi:CheY-like chemotaxis protein